MNGHTKLDHINPLGTNIRFVVSTKESEETFYKRSALGRTLKFYHQSFIEVRLFESSFAPLPALYNTAIEEATQNPAILIFCHDYVHISDYFWIDKLIEGLSDFDVLSIAGNKVCRSNQPHWLYRNTLLELDDESNLSGIFGVGSGYPLMKIESFGSPGCQVRIVDGSFIAIQSKILIENKLRFDETFPCYMMELDFSRQVANCGLKMGTVPISSIREKFSPLDNNGWKLEFSDYLTKWGGNTDLQEPMDKLLAGGNPEKSIAGSSVNVGDSASPHSTPAQDDSFITQIYWGVKNPPLFHALLSTASKLVAPNVHIGDNFFTWCRNNSFLKDSKFLESFKKNIVNTSDEGIAWRRFILARAAFHCAKLDGDFVECGVYQGTGIKTVADYLTTNGIRKIFWGYDTFDYNPVQGHEFEGQREGFFEKVKERFTGYDTVKLIKGFIPNSFSDGVPDKIAYLHIDLNNAEAEINVLDHLFHKVVPSGLIILDDYEWAGFYKDQKIAEDPWFESRNHKVFALPTGQGIVIKN